MIDATASLFRHVTADKARLYRTILSAFASARRQFRLQLRPDEVVVEAEWDGAIPTLEEMNQALQSLTEWGNLESQPDNARVSSITDFYRAKFLYRLSQGGEAVEAALQVFAQTMRRKAELQAAALEDISSQLHALKRIVAEHDIDVVKAHESLRDLVRRFESLTENAQAFMAGVARGIELQRAEASTVVRYKGQLIEYIERFIGEFVRRSDGIASAIVELSPAIDALLYRVAEREAGWPLYVERDGARLYKRPGDTRDGSRGLEGYDRRRYVLLSLACAVLERSDAQITLRLLGDQLLSLAADPNLESRGFAFSLTTPHERRELVSVCKTLLEHGVLTRVAGDEDAFVQASGGEADALYDLHRRMLAGMLAAVRGPSTWPADTLPISLEERLESLTREHVLDSDEGRRTALRHVLTRRLLDDPVIYLDELSQEEHSYFANQRGPIATRVCAATGLFAEQRAEGVALVDAEGDLTDIAMPAEGTDAHVTLLIAERLSSDLKARLVDPGSASAWPDLAALAAFVTSIRDQFGRFWRRSAREPGSELDLAQMAVSRLERLNLVRLVDGVVRPMPALARFALGDTQVQRLRSNDEPTPAAAQLFD